VDQIYRAVWVRWCTGGHVSFYDANGYSLTRGIGQQPGEFVQRKPAEFLEGGHAALQTNSPTLI